MHLYRNSLFIIILRLTLSKWAAMRVTVTITSVSALYVAAGGSWPTCPGSCCSPVPPLHVGGSNPGALRPQPPATPCACPDIAAAPSTARGYLRDKGTQTLRIILYGPNCTATCGNQATRTDLTTWQQDLIKKLRKETRLNLHWAKWLVTGINEFATLSQCKRLVSRTNPLKPKPVQ